MEKRKERISKAQHRDGGDMSHLWSKPTLVRLSGSNTETNTAGIMSDSATTRATVLGS